MRKSINVRTMQKHRRRLLTTVSAIALMAFVQGADGAQAVGNDTDRPPVWIELGWHYEQVSGQGDLFAPPFVLVTPQPDFETKAPLNIENILLYSYGADGKIAFQPDRSDWVFTAAVRFGRSHGRKHQHQQTPGKTQQTTFRGVHRTVAATYYEFADTRASANETHMIVDFQAGKDVGIGLLGSQGNSVFAAGVRFAQFSSNTGAAIDSRPDVHFTPFYFKPFHHTFYIQAHRTFDGAGNSAHKFSGIGPSISWNSSAPLVGDVEDGEITLDLGANASVLFGRQKTNGHHNTTGIKKGAIQQPKYYTRYQHSADPARSRNATVPNVGGVAGLTYRIQDLKLSLGYRGDFFFGAIDGGVDERKSTTRGYYGPFASISVGLGD